VTPANATSVSPTEAMAKPSNTAAAFLFEKEVHMCVSDGKKLGPAAAAVDKVDYACRKHDAYHASSNLRSRNGNGISECVSYN
jgi:hypothetical protein